MTVERFAPEPGLEALVESILLVRAGEEFVHTLPPNPAPVLAFRVDGVTSQLTTGGETILPRLALTGVNHAPRVIRYQPGAAMLLVRFREGAASAVTRTPLHEGARLTVSLDSLIDPARAHQLEDQLGSAQGRSRLTVVNEFLRATAHDPRDPMVDETLRRIRSARGTVGIRSLVSDLATNVDSLEKRFRQRVGLGPKLFARLVRFQAFVDAYVPGTSLAVAAVGAGFYDQAHLVREFQMFTGQPPLAYLSAPRRW